MKRGDIVTVAVSGDYGKPRPAVVIQSDRAMETDSVLVCLVTSTLRDAPIFRLTIEPTPQNGLQRTSQAMIEKITAVPRAKCGSVIGRLDQETRLILDQMLTVIVGIAD